MSKSRRLAFARLPLLTGKLIPVTEGLEGFPPIPARRVQGRLPGPERWPFILAWLFPLISPGFTAPIAFQKVVLSNVFIGEGPSVGDFNRDGKLDVAAGPFWWQGPDFTTKAKYSAEGQESYPPGSYAYHYMNLPARDINGDGWDDIPYLIHAGGAGFWMENPKVGPGPWKKSPIGNQIGNEAASFRKLFPEGKEVLIYADGSSKLGWGEPDPADPYKSWRFHPINPELKYGHTSHGVGAGDINGDGRVDMIIFDAWYEQPASLEGDPVWKLHKHPFGDGTRGGGAQIFTDDLDGDGDADVVTSLDGHGWGLAWYENMDGKGDAWTRHMIMGTREEESKYGAAFSQLHSLGYADLDGDGLKDIISGKRYYAHGAAGDPEPQATPVLYWFKQVRGAAGTLFQPFLIDTVSGSGVAMDTRDLNGDGYADLAISSKKGSYLFLSKDRPPLAVLARPGTPYRPWIRLNWGTYYDLCGAKVNRPASTSKVLFPWKKADP